MVRRVSRIATGLAWFLLLAPLTAKLGLGAVANASAPAPTPPIRAPFAVIAHPSVARDSIGVDELEAIALGRIRYWQPGAPIQLVLGREDAPSRRVWVHDVADMSNAQFTQFWIGVTFRGRAVVTPRAVPSDAMAVRLVAALPGAVAIVPAALISDDVRVVALGDTGDQHPLERLLQ